jgi:GT2 family glycosyltransferase
MDVSIVIVNYNTTELLINAIDSVLAKTESIEYEIIVVDNNSPDNPQDILIKKYGNKISYLGLSENIGFGRANNEGIKIAKGRNLFLLNSDTVLLNNAVKILSDYLDNNPDVGCCGGNLLDEDEKPRHSFRRFFTSSIFDEINQLFFGLPEIFLYGKNMFYNHTNKPLKVCYITGADLMIRKNLFHQLHGFDPDFFMYHEEAELEYRISKINYGIVSVPYAKIIHLEGKSFSYNFDKMEKLLSSRLIFLQKIYSKMIISIVNILFFIRIISRLFIFITLQHKEKIDLYLKIYKFTMQVKQNSKK